jgi:small subunit ribosomal protein S6
LRDYELVVIVNPEVPEENISVVTDRIASWMTDGGGEVTNTNVWGRRRLAYPINEQREGIYVVYQVTTTAKATVELERSLRLSEEVLRHLLVRMGD